MVEAIDLNAEDAEDDEEGAADEDDVSYRTQWRQQRLDDELQARSSTDDPAIAAPAAAAVTDSLQWAPGQHTDASQAIFEPPPDNWRRPPGRPRTTWMKNVHNDLSSLEFGIHEARDLAQNRPLWRLMSLHSITHS